MDRNGELNPGCWGVRVVGIVVCCNFLGEQFFSQPDMTVMDRTVKILKTTSEKKGKTKEAPKDTVLEQNLASLVHFSCTFVADCGFSSIRLVHAIH